jgi:hypothetical protein
MLYGLFDLRSKRPEQTLSGSFPSCMLEIVPPFERQPVNDCTLDGSCPATA